MSLSHFARIMPLATTPGTFGGRLVAASGTVLDLRPFLGQLITVRDRQLLLQGTGVSNDITADNLITATGADAAALPVAGSIYHVYVSESEAFPFPLSLRLSSTAPTAIDGINYLGAADNAARWLHCGWVRLSAGGQLVNTRTQRYVVNRYNQVFVPAECTPNYQDDNADDTWSINSAAWATVTVVNGTNSFSFLGDGSSLELDLFTTLLTPDVAQTAQVGIGVSVNGGATTMAAACRFAAGAATAPVPGGCRTVIDTVEGSLYTVTFRAQCVGTAVFLADMVRNGAAADPVGSALSCLLPT